MAALLIVALLILLLVLKFGIDKVRLHQQRARIARDNGCRPVRRYPHRDPILGLDRMRHLMKARAELKFIETMEGMFTDIGPTFSFKLLTETVLTTADPANMKAIYSTNFMDFDSAIRGRLLRPFLGEGIFTTDGEVWQHSRAMIRPNFSRTQVANIEAIEQILQDMLNLLPADGSTVDLQPLFFGMSIDTSTEFLFGESVHSLRGGEADTTARKFVDAFETASWHVAVRATTGILAIIKGMSSEEKNAIQCCRDHVQKFVDNAIEWQRSPNDDRKPNPTGQYTFLYELVKETTDPVRVRAEVLNLLLAGRDTTASLLSNMFFQLSKRPDLWQRLREEVEPLHGAMPTFEQLKSMQLLQRCMKESLRVNTVVPGTFRTACKDTILPKGGGADGQSPVFVPKGTIVSTFFAAMHRQHDIWGTNSHHFDPDRWEKIRPGAWDYLPFSGGPRICIGQQYALTEAGYITARMVQMYAELESRDPGPWTEKLSITCASGNGVKVGLIPASGK